MFQSHWRLYLTNLLFAIVISGCSSDSLPRERVAVGGSVTMDDLPLADVNVVFVPHEPSDGRSVSATIEEGMFFINKTQGPMAGKLRVEFHPIGVEVEELEQMVAQGKKPKIFKTKISDKYRKGSRIHIVSANVDTENWYEFKLDPVE